MASTVASKGSPGTAAQRKAPVSQPFTSEDPNVPLLWCPCFQTPFPGPQRDLTPQAAPVTRVGGEGEPTLPQPRKGPCSHACRSPRCLYTPLSNAKG